MNMKSLSITLSITLVATTAFAADLPSRRLVPTVPVAPVFSWTGLYIGGQVGYEFGKSNALLFSSVTGAGIAGNSGSPDGVVGGAHIGYLFSTQSLPVLGALFGGFGTGGVIGVEGNIDGSSARTDYVLGTVNNYSNEPVQGSLRGRLGVAFNRTLVYATGGAAFAYVRNNYASLTVANVNNQLDTGRIGYTVGGGVEYSFTDVLSARVEYRYTDYGSFNQFDTPTAAFSASHRESDNRVQAGFSYKIAPPTLAPVVARY